MPPKRALMAGTGRLLVFSVVAILSVASTWLFGGTLISHQVWFVLLAAIALIGATLVAMAGPSPPKLPALAFVLAGGVALGVLQLVPLSAAWQSALSPTAVALRQDLQSDINATLRPAREPLSLYAGSTRRDLSQLIVPCAVFLAAVAAFPAGQWQRAFCWFFTGHGVLVALFGLIQQLTFNGKLFWTVTLSQGGTPFASFVNRNHAAAHLNLCLAGLLPLLVWEFRRRDLSAWDDSHAISSGQSWITQVWDRLWDRFAALTGTAMLLVGAAVIMIAAIFCTSSRGGITALVLAGLWTAAWIVLRQLRTSAWVVLAATAVVGVAMTFWVGQGESVAQRFESLSTDWRKATGSRWNHWRQSAAIVPDFLAMGTGLGTYRYIYPRYQIEAEPAWYYHAENQYLESLVEAGLPGLTLVVAAVALSLYYSARKFQRNTLDWPSAMGLGGMFAVAATALQAGVDFHLYMPANAILLAAVVALQVPTGSSVSADRHGDVDRSGRYGVILVTHLVAGAALAWSYLVLQRAATADTLRRAWLRDVAERPQDVSTVDASINALLPVAEGDADACSIMAAMHLWKYRIGAWKILQQELGESANRDLLWESTDPLVLHQQLHQSVESGTSVLARLSHLRRPIEDAGEWYERALISCPTRGANHLALAKLAPLAVTREMERRYLDRAVQVAPVDPAVLFQAGRLARHAGWTDLAFVLWNRSLRNSDRHLIAILRLLEADAREPADRATEYSRLFNGIPQRAVEAARASARFPALAKQSVLLAQVAQAVIEQSPLDDPTHQYLLAGIARVNNQIHDAVSHLEKAVSARPEAVYWRAELVELLVSVNRNADAYRHAMICAETDRRSPAFKQLLKKASRQLHQTGQD